MNRFHQDGHDRLGNHLTDFISPYNFGQRLSTLKGLRPASSSANNRQPNPKGLPKPDPSNAGNDYLNHSTANFRILRGQQAPPGD